MKKLLVALTVVIFAVGLALPAMAQLAPPAIEDGYAEVYMWDGTNWVLLDPADRECELYLQGSQHEQYRWQSDTAATICSGPYLPPHPEPLRSNDLFVKNYLHYFPWIEMVIWNNDIVWDVFKPGDYMGKVFMLSLQANCPVLIHFGSGTFPAPVGFKFDPYDKDGEIIIEDVTIPDTDANSADNKWWQYSMLKDTNTGTPPDEIEVMYWWEQGTVDDWNDPHHVTTTVPDKDNVVDSPKGPFPAGWVKAPGLNCDYTIIPDTDELHTAKYIMFYEDINVEVCDSEGKYFDEFVITIVPDP